MGTAPPPVNRNHHKGHSQEDNDKIISNNHSKNQGIHNHKHNSYSCRIHCQDNKRNCHKYHINRDYCNNNTRYNNNITIIINKYHKKLGSSSFKLWTSQPPSKPFSLYLGPSHKVQHSHFPKIVGHNRYTHYSQPVLRKSSVAAGILPIYRPERIWVVHVLRRRRKAGLVHGMGPPRRMDTWGRGCFASLYYHQPKEGGLEDHAWVG